MPNIAKRGQDGSAVELTVSTRTVLRVSAIIIVILIVIWGAYTARHSIVLILISFFLALALNAPVHFIAKHLPGRLKGSRTLGTTISYLIVIIILGSFLAYVLPPLVRQTGNFIQAAPKIVSEFRNQSGAVGNFIRHYHLGGAVKSVSDQLSARLHNIGGTAFSSLVAISKSVFAVLTVIVLTFMMLVEGPRWISIAKRVIPEKRHQLADRLARDMYLVIKNYVNGQVILALIATAFITPALFILHVSHPVALIAVVFIAGLIPLVGHTIGAIIVTVVALFHSVTSGVAILIYYILYQQFENYIIQPKLQANATRISPLLVLVSLVIGINFGGLFGGLVAIPVMACIRIIALEVLRYRKYISENQFEEAASRPSDNATVGH